MYGEVGDLSKTARSVVCFVACACLGVLWLAAGADLVRGDGGGGN